MKKSVVCVEKSACTGCGLCAEKCPKECISMRPDSEGFLAPFVDVATCVDCGLCLNVCPTGKAADALYHQEEQEYFCAISLDANALLKSSSGGLFAILSNAVLQNGGYVCGCIYNEQMEAVHTVTNDPATVLHMYGSKYVQSRAFPCFPKIKSLLESGKTVLFTGTACQIAACRLFLAKEYENIYFVEILCHGVPSPAFFAIYVRHLEKKLGGRVLDIQFRNKEKHGWGSEHRTCVIYEKNGKIKKHRPFLPAYFSAFFYGMNLRESCYRCRYADKKRIADLTIGDFWGSWAKYGKRFDEGISVAAANTKKGKLLADQIKQCSSFFEVLTQTEAIKSNDNFEHPIPRPRERSAFYSERTIKNYRGSWKKAYLSSTYRKKTLASIYGAIVPAKFRFALQKIKRRRKH